MRLYDNIRNYGAQAVLGRVMWAHEVIRCNVASSTFNLKRKTMHMDNFSKWAEKNPDEAEMLANVEKLIKEMENA